VDVIGAQRLPLFLGIAALLIVTPGQDTALTIRNTLLGGRSAGIFTGLGVALGQAAWALTASLGVGTLLSGSVALHMLGLAGAAYLVYLGAMALHTALTRDLSALQPRMAGTANGQHVWRSALRQGLVSNLTNPKMLPFFLSILPQFTPADGRAFGLISLGLLFAAMTLAWLALYAVIIGKAVDVLRRPGVMRSLQGFTGGSLIALGVGMAIERL
jgi:threonine/homoserine/homoserine lactone efflux protein